MLVVQQKYYNEKLRSNKKIRHVWCMALVHIFKELNQKRKKVFAGHFRLKKKLPILKLATFKRKEEYGKSSEWQALPPSIKIV